MGRPPFPEASPEEWDTLAPGYDAEAHDFTAQFARDAVRLAAVRPGERVLDVAAGTGALALLGAELGAEVSAVDFAAAMLARLDARAARAKLAVRTEVMDGQRLRFPAGRFDAAFSCFGVIFFPDPSSGLAELRRVLRPGGRCAVVAWAAPGRGSLFAAVAASVAEALGGAAPEPPALRLSDPDDLAGALRAAGFEAVRVEAVAHPMTFASPRDAWASIRRTTPPSLQALFEKVGPAATRRIGTALGRRLAAEHGPGPLALPTEALIGIGRTPGAS